MQDDRYLIIAILELITIHLFLGGATLLYGAITGLTATTLVLGISYTLLLALILLYFLDARFAEKLVEKTIIKEPKTTPFLLLISLLFFIFCVLLGGNAAALIDGVNVSPTPEMALASAVISFFICFFGPLAYVALATGQGTKASMGTLNLRFTKRSFLYFLAGVPALLVLNGAVSYALYFLQELFNFQLAENVVAIDMSQGMSVAVAFVMSALTAFGEELFFRGFMQNRAGVLLTTIIFTAPHISYGNLSEIILAFIFSLVMGYSVKKFKDLGFAIGMHFTNNFATIILINYFPHLLGA